MTPVFLGILLLADFLAVVFQSSLPPIPSFFGAWVMIFPVILAYGALALPFPAVLALGFFNGLIYDALNVQFVRLDPLSTDSSQIMEISLGTSIVIYTALAVLVHGLRPLFLRGRWDIHCLASGLCGAIIPLSEYFLITFRRGGLVFPREVWARALLPGFFAMLLAPVFFFGFNFIARLIGYSVRQEEEVGRRRRRGAA